MSEYITIEQLRQLSPEKLKLIVEPYLDELLSATRFDVYARPVNKQEVMNDIDAFVRGEYLVRIHGTDSSDPHPPTGHGMVLLAMDPCTGAIVEVVGASVALVVQAIMAGITIGSLPAKIGSAIGKAVFGGADDVAITGYKAAIRVAVKELWDQGTNVSKAKAVILITVKGCQFVSFTAIVDAIKEEVSWKDLLVTLPLIGLQIGALVATEGVSEVFEVAALIPTAANVALAVDEYHDKC